jgi:HD-GYP domain-containing protein (c-di-GMP phosphodiesterase class II)
LDGAEIPIRARIFAVADVFDALTSRRPYKEPFSLEETVEILEKGRGIHFDPALLDRFLEMAPVLYEELSGREDEGLRQEVDEVGVAQGLEQVHSRASVEDLPR